MFAKLKQKMLEQRIAEINEFHLTQRRIERMKKRPKPKKAWNGVTKKWEYFQQPSVWEKRQKKEQDKLIYGILTMVIPFIPWILFFLFYIYIVKM